MPAKYDIIAIQTNNPAKILKNTMYNSPRTNAIPTEPRMIHFAILISFIQPDSVDIFKYLFMADSAPAEKLANAEAVGAHTLPRTNLKYENLISG